ncbi:MAG: hypothetical protein H0W88_11710 [Parachlamydiaceae bacterium]|nr:hypothetical protein [Parachlamydiaceae bacterium]
MKISTLNTTKNIATVKENVKKYLPIDSRIYAVILGIFTLIGLAYILKRRNDFKVEQIRQDKANREKADAEFLPIKTTAAAMMASIKDLENITDDEFYGLDQPIQKLIEDSKIKALKRPENPKIEERVYCYNFRFEDIECPEHTVLALKGEKFGITGKKPTIGDNSDFLHANEMDIRGQRYIAGQYPVHRELFWSTIKDQVNVIVDLTNDADLRKRDTILTSYVPDVVEPIKYPSGLTVNFKSETVKEGFTTYKYLVNGSGVDKEISRIHFTDWEDKQGLEDISKLTKMIDYILKEFPQNANTRPFIHCRAGVGRTGTLITCLALAAFINNGTVKTKDELKTKMFEAIVEGRLQRGITYVQTPDQLGSIWKFANSYLDSKKSKLLTQLEKLPK